MIESIFIIDVGSGIPLFSHDLIEIEGSKSLDKEIFSSFLKVLNDFSQETRNESINEVKLVSSRLIYEKLTISGREVLCISIDDMKGRSKKIRKVLKTIGEKLESEHADQVRNFTGRVDIFASFKQEVEKIITIEFGTVKERMKLKREEHPLKSIMSRLKEKHLEKMAEFKQKYDKIKEDLREK